MTRNYDEKMKRSLINLGFIFVVLALAVAAAGYLSYRNFEQQFRAQVESQPTAVAALEEDELRERLWETVIFFGALIFAVGAGLALVWRQQDVRYYRQQMQVAAALQESEERFHLLFENHGAIMLLIDPHTGLILDANQAAVNFYGYPKTELCGMSIDAINTLSPEQIAAERQKALTEERHYFVFTHRLASGVERMVEVHSSPVPFQKKQALFSIIHDITERKRAEEAVRESERKLATLFSNLIGFAYRCRNDQNWTMEFVSSGCVALTGYAVEDLVGNHTLAYNDVVHPDDRQPMWDAVQRSVSARKPFQIEYRLITRAGAEKWVWEQGRGIFADNTLEALEGYITDITDLKTAQNELLELNRSLEARVQERTAEVRDLYENAPIGYHALDENGIIIMINQTELTWLGYTRAELVGRPVSTILTPAALAKFRATFDGFIQRGWIRDLESEMIRKNGSIIPVLINATAIYNEQGNYVMSRSTVFDNSERKKAENALRESEEQNRLLFEEAPEAVVLFDDASRVIRINRAFETLTGCTSRQIIGQLFSEAGLLPTEQIEQLGAKVARYLQSNQGVATAEFRLTTATGSPVDVETRVFGLQINGRQHYLASMRDVTVEKQAAETLRRANAELARAARAKDEFLANMSHELRTPLNAILNFSESLQEHIYGPLNERQQAPVRHIEASGRHLLTLINDILDLSKVEAGRMDLQPETVPVAEVCQASLLFVKEMAIKKSLRLGFQLNDQAAALNADPKRLKQMLVNLLSNAVKFTPTGGQVSLDVVADAENGVIRFAVQDSGIGIPPDELARLFQPFVQLDSSLSRQYEGSGLGLALVRRLAELHGGSITIESEVGRGSRFTLALPYGPPHAGETPAQPEARSDPLPRSALVVEDLGSAAEQLTRYLQEMNLRTVVHPQGEGVLQQALGLQPGVIFLDLLMPDQSGWAVLAQLKAEPRTRDIPVVIVSIVDERAKGLSAGAAGYLVKPVSRDMVRQALHTASAAPRIGRELPVSAAHPEPAPTGARILLAEDSEANILVIEDYLNVKGYQVMVARDGQAALAQVEAFEPDLILMDIQMPHLDGLEATRRLRAMPKFANTPVIALTALAMPGDRERCLEAGANAYITKPVVLKEILATIEAMLK